MNSINRETIVINLDPAVKSPDAAIDICALGLVSDYYYGLPNWSIIDIIFLISYLSPNPIFETWKVEHAEVMEEMELGPNGGLIFCMELLLENKGNAMKYYTFRFAHT